MVGVRIVSGHGWRIIGGGTLVRVIEIIILGVSAGSGDASVHRRSVVVVIVDREVGKCGLRKGFGDEFTFLVLQMRIITPSLLLSELGGISETLLLPALDNGANALLGKSIS